MGCSSSKPDERQEVPLQRSNAPANDNDGTHPVQGTAEWTARSQQRHPVPSQLPGPRPYPSATAAVDNVVGSVVRSKQRHPVPSQLPDSRPYPLGSTSGENTMGFGAKSQKSPPEPSEPPPNPSSTTKPPTDEVGLHILHDGGNAAIDIVAVHGLGANPKYTWCWNPKDNPPGKEGYPKESFNWLEKLPDSLRESSKIPCRVMVFNHISRWITKAPQQRISNISDRLLDFIASKRENAGHRPLIFIGHSFGGNLIEHAIDSAAREASPHRDIAAATAGVIFLGTPHLGCSAARWTWLVAAVSGTICTSEDKIVKALVKDSDVLVNCLKHFCRWLIFESVPVVCFFENLETDFLKIGKVAKVLPAAEKLLVPELSAVIFGHHQVQLHSDHSKMNKYYGVKDPSYELVFKQIERMARGAEELLSRRRTPRLIPEFNTLPNSSLKDCLQRMRVTDPKDILQEIEDEKEKRVTHTCNWILTPQGKFSHWANIEASQLLRISGPPGIGKTMIATFIVETIKTRMKNSSNGAFAYFFCDDKKGEDRRMPAAILRSLIWQLLLQNSGLFKHLKGDFQHHERKRVFEEVFQNFSTMWRVFRDMVRDIQAQKGGEVFILIDAFDECDEDSHGKLLTKIHGLFSDQPELLPGRIKFLLTHRLHILDIDQEFRGLSPSVSAYLEIDSNDIKHDVEEYIESKIHRLITRKPDLKGSEDRIRHVLRNGHGGTFLWVSLMVAEITRPNVLNFRVEELLSRPPSGLDGIYASILNRIPSENQAPARFILQCMVAAKRPLTKIEMKIAFATFSLPTKNIQQSKLHDQNKLHEYNDVLSACSSILILSHQDARDSATVSFCHQTVKDFLLNKYSRTREEWYLTSNETANVLLFEICWKYLTAEGGLLAESIKGYPRQPGRGHIPGGDFSQGRKKYPTDERWNKWGKRAEAKVTKYVFLEYVFSMWQRHAMSSYPEVQKHLAPFVKNAPELADIWFLCAVGAGKVEIMQLLLSAKKDVVSKVGQFRISPLSLAAKNGHLDAVTALLAERAETDTKDTAGRTPLSYAAGNGHVDVVKRLLATGKVDIESRSIVYETPLIWAARGGHLGAVKELLSKGANIDWKTAGGSTALTVASVSGHRAVVEELRARGAKFEPNTGEALEESDAEVLPVYMWSDPETESDDGA